MASKKTSLFLLNVVLFVYSIAGVVSKLAASEEFLSIPFIAYYAGVVLLLGVYALAWQQVIKRLPLTTAFMNKAITVFWGMLWGVLLFGETLNIFKILGGVLVAIGVILFVLADKDGLDDMPSEDELLGEGL